MSQKEHAVSNMTDIADEVEGWERMKARQVTIHEWRVLSWRNDGITAHEVDLRDLSCSCRDMDYNQEDAGVCDHIAKALFMAERTIDIQAALDHEMRSQMLDLKDSVRAIERRAAGVQADVAHEEANADSDGTGASDDSWDGDPVEATKSLLRDAGWPVDQLDIWVDDQFGSVQIDNCIQDDTEWEQFNDWARDQEFLQYDREEYNNYIKPEQFPEVFG